MKKLLVSMCLVLTLILTSIPVFAYTEQTLDSFNQDSSGKVTFEQYAFNNDTYYFFNSVDKPQYQFNYPHSKMNIKIKVDWSNLPNAGTRYVRVNIGQVNGIAYPVWVDLFQTSGSKTVTSTYYPNVNGPFYIEIIGVGLSGSNIKVTGEVYP
ncbi:hypothetical protein HZI73_04625 [Vallitalea pronyensis]|uniref:Uncharacterized protein n=1 Tax=Vallitalea pronyensis TaxID=1348613 RepID=A0A8J8MH95_9FIRM|nr:hypothetical protein [Vallitalea pronyensis]QUI21620.1 hypothetical protein HZI73_04625 [Vallitalea pronyensis]